MEGVLAYNNKLYLQQNLNNLPAVNLIKRSFLEDAILPIQDGMLGKLNLQEMDGNVGMAKIMEQDSMQSRLIMT